jgi:acetyl-CoA C-acetyltransferase
MTSYPIIVSAYRTIVAPRSSVLAPYDLGALSAPVIQACLRAARVVADDVDEIIVSNALAAGGNPARFCALAAGLPQRVAGLSIDRQCVGGLDTFQLGAAMIASGQANVVIVGGVESHSQRPLRMANPSGAAVAIPYDRPAFSPHDDPDPDQAMAIVAAKHGLNQSDQDDWAIKSHQKARLHQSSLAREIVEIGASGHIDPYARDLTEQICRRAKKIAGSVTFANTAVAADGAAFAIMMSADFAESRGIQGVSFLGARTIGGDPTEPALAPVPAILDVLHQFNVDPQSLDHVEMMEAYAAQAMLCSSLTRLPSEVINQKGGALARGHPIGASGAILAVRLFHDLSGTSKTGLAAIAAAGGIGTAAVFRGRG